MRPMTLSHAFAAIVAAGLLAVAGGCGDDDEDQAAMRPAPGEEQAAAPPEAPTEIVGGDTVLRLDATLERVLDVAGVKVEPVGQAEATDSGIRFPIAAGEVDIDTLSGRLEHQGGLRFSAAGQSLEATDLVIRPGDGVLTADVAGNRVPLLSLDFGRPRVPQESDTVVLPGTAGTLADEAVAELNEQLGVDVFEGGLRLGEVTTSAKRP